MKISKQKEQQVRGVPSEGREGSSFWELPFEEQWEGQAEGAVHARL
jgi:hypothetical protein